LKRKSLLLAGMALVLYLAACNRQAAPSPDVWAVVDGKQVLRQDVEKVYRTRVNANGGTTPPSQEEALSLKLSILDDLIDNDILLDRATQLNLVASDAEVEDKFTEEKAPYTEEEFQKKLKDSELTVDDLKSEIRTELSIEKLVNREVIAKISITDQDIGDYYNANKTLFNVPETQYHIARIVVTPKPDNTVHNLKNDKAGNEADAGRKVVMLEKQLEGGADFSQLAMDYSEDSSASTGGDIGFIGESSLNPPADPALKKAVLSLKPGQVSAPIQTKDGSYNILKLIAKEPAGDYKLSDPQVQQQIRDLLRSRKEQLLRSAYLIEVRDGAHVTNYLARQIIESAGKLPAGN
jgi:peptidyl-prolyl cis-trans isomerase SurA